jgi:hypothetical protein
MSTPLSLFSNSERERRLIGMSPGPAQPSPEQSRNPAEVPQETRSPETADTMNVSDASDRRQQAAESALAQSATRIDGSFSVSKRQVQIITNIDMTSAVEPLQNQVNEIQASVAALEERQARMEQVGPPLTASEQRSLTICADYVRIYEELMADRRDRRQSSLQEKRMSGQEGQPAADKAQLKDTQGQAEPRQAGISRFEEQLREYDRELRSLNQDRPGLRAYNSYDRHTAVLQLLGDLQAKARAAGGNPAGGFSFTVEQTPNVADGGSAGPANAPDVPQGAPNAPQGAPGQAAEEANAGGPQKAPEQPEDKLERAFEALGRLIEKIMQLIDRIKNRSASAPDNKERDGDAEVKELTVDKILNDPAMTPEKVKESHGEKKKQHEENKTRLEKSLPKEKKDLQARGEELRGEEDGLLRRVNAAKNNQGPAMAEAPGAERTGPDGKTWKKDATDLYWHNGDEITADSRMDEMTAELRAQLPQLEQQLQETRESIQKNTDALTRLDSEQRQLTEKQKTLEEEIDALAKVMKIDEEVASLTKAFREDLPPGVDLGDFTIDRRGLHLGPTKGELHKFFGKEPGSTVSLEDARTALELERRNLNVPPNPPDSTSTPTPDRGGLGGPPEQLPGLPNALREFQSAAQEIEESIVRRMQMYEARVRGTEKDLQQERSRGALQGGLFNNSLERNLEGTLREERASLESTRTALQRFQVARSRVVETARTADNAGDAREALKTGIRELRDIRLSIRDTNYAALNKELDQVIANFDAVLSVPSAILEVPAKLDQAGQWLGESGYALYKNTIAPAVGRLDAKGKEKFAQVMQAINEIKTGILHSSAEDFGRGYKEQFMKLYGSSLDEAKNLLVQAGLDRTAVDQFATAVSTYMEEQFDAAVQTVDNINRYGLDTVLEGFANDMGTIVHTAYNEHIKPHVDRASAEVKRHFANASQYLREVSQGTQYMYTDIQKNGWKGTSVQYMQQFDRLYGPAIENAIRELVQAGVPQSGIDALKKGIKQQFKERIQRFYQA